MCDATLESIVVDGAALAILTGTPRVRDLIYATDATAKRLDELQFILGEGPCLDSVIRNGPHLWADLDAGEVEDFRWPTFATEAIEAGVRALFAFPVPGQLRPIGALELYRRSPGPLTAAEIDCAETTATALGELLDKNWNRYRDSAGGTAAALEAAVLDGAEGTGGSQPFSRAAIHIAAGIVAVQLGVSPGEALDLLRAHCYASGTSTDDTAADVIAHRLMLDRRGPQ
jgi:hypothetical protein